MSKIKQVIKDKELVKQACNHDSYAMEQLLIRYQEKTLNLVHHYVNSHADVEDITQEVLFKLYRSLETFQFSSSFNTWHYRIVMNTINSHFRHNSQRIFSNAVNLDDFYNANQVPHSLDNPELQLQAEQTLRACQTRYATLSPELCEIMSYRDFHGGSYEEIAQKFNYPIGTIRSKIHRARNFLNKPS